MSRKTIPVEEVREAVNRMLRTANSTLHLDGLTTEQAFRMGAASLLEYVLHTTGNYRGYGYQQSEHTDTPPYAPNTTGLRVGYDDTRRRYL